MTRFLHLLTSSGAFGLAWYAHAALAPATGLYVSAGFATGGVIVLLFALLPRSTDKTIVRLGGLTWNRLRRSRPSGFGALFLPGAPSWQQETEPTAQQKKILALLETFQNRSQ
jgi:hypothetical protein